MTRPKIDKLLRAQFKELARRIVTQDRSARKYGQSQNTIGQIERALCDAFMLGRNPDAVGMANEPNGQGFIEWIEIPPRARDTLFEFSTGLTANTKRSSPPETMLELILIDGRRRWRIVGDDRKDSHTFADGGVAPLIKLGLLERLDAPGARYALSDLGIATCLEFWRRWNERDPTLPLMGMRG